MATDISDAQFIMYCGKKLTHHSTKLASAMLMAQRHSCKATDCLPEFFDFSNPDPASDKTEEVKGVLTLANMLYDMADCVSTWKVWKITGVSNFDVAVHEVSL